MNCWVDLLNSAGGQSAILAPLVCSFLFCTECLKTLLRCRSLTPLLSTAPELSGDPSHLYSRDSPADSYEISFRPVSVSLETLPLPFSVAYSRSESYFPRTVQPSSVQSGRLPSTPPPSVLLSICQFLPPRLPSLMSREGEALVPLLLSVPTALPA